jgi:hypothetical protein
MVGITSKNYHVIAEDLCCVIGPLWGNVRVDEVWSRPFWQVELSPCLTVKTEHKHLKKNNTEMAQLMESGFPKIYAYRSLKSP